MRIRLAAALSVLALLLAPAVAHAQDAAGTATDAADTSVRRHRLVLHTGFAGATDGEAVTDGAEVDASADLNVTFGLGYAYALSRAWSAGGFVRLLRVSASTTASLSDGVSSSSAVVPVLAGVRYRPPVGGAAVRPFVGAYAGAYVGAQTVSDTAGFTDVSAASTTEATPGAYLHAGLDVALGRRFVLEAEGGYHLVRAFDAPIGATRDPGGFAAGVGVGVRF
jgi:hypothetical protein